MEHKRSQAIYEEAVKYIPGGVNSPVRAFKSVGIDPIFIELMVVIFGMWMVMSILTLYVHGGR